LVSKIPSSAQGNRDGVLAGAPDGCEVTCDEGNNNDDDDKQQQKQIDNNNMK